MASSYAGGGSEDSIVVYGLGLSCGLGLGLKSRRVVLTIAV